MVVLCWPVDSPRDRLAPMGAERKVLVVGSGGREAALARRLLESPSVSEVWVNPGNAGTACAQARSRGDQGPAKVLRNVVGSPVDVARQAGIGLVVVGPEAPLVEGLADRLRHEGIAVFGPTAAAARLEGSKSFMKAFAARHGLRTARSCVVADLAAAERAIRGFEAPPVVKADGLCAGKGVVVSASHEEALAAARGMLSGETFGDPGRTVVIEEHLTGEEASVHAISDGERTILLPSAQDHKRLLDGDVGPNTGGMGAYAPAPLITPALEQQIERDIIQRAIWGMKEEGCRYQGVLYAGLMITAQGEPYLLEFNVRFGDPETQVLVDSIEGDLAAALCSAAEGHLEADALSARAGHTLCVVLAAAGYPESPRRGDPITGLEAAEALRDVAVYHAGTRQEGDRIVTAGGRVLGVTGRGTTLAKAREQAYLAVDLIHFEGKQARRDIGHRALGVP